MNLRSMKYHEEDTTTAITKVVTTKPTIKVRQNIIVRRIGTRTPRVFYQKEG